MAEEVANALIKNENLIVEAGTGTGKTLAYLLPSLLFGGKVIVSTGTKNLQDQLYFNDIPIVRNVLEFPISVSLLKGRSNYLCHFYFQKTLNSEYILKGEEILYLRKISEFIKITKDGDKSELSSVPENAVIWDLVTSTKDNCLGSECKYYNDCFIVKARKKAQKADLIVINHHLFFADFLLKDYGMFELLPNADTIIFDEAHQLPQTANTFFGKVFSTNQILDLNRDILIEGLTHARDALKWDFYSKSLENTIKNLRISIKVDKGKFTFENVKLNKNFSKIFLKLRLQIYDLVKILNSNSQRAESLKRCADRALEILNYIDLWQIGKKKNIDSDIFWIEVFSKSIKFHKTPIEISSFFKKFVKNSTSSWIFTSATLSIKKDFSHYLNQLGLTEEKALSWSSPFDFKNQAILYSPLNVPLPNSENYIEKIIAAALPVIKAAGGRTFFLCTTVMAAKKITFLLKRNFEREPPGFPILTQGELPRHELISKFIESGNAVLVGSQSFWEGVDIKGKTLSLVIIDKIPFIPPDNPVIAAKLANLEKNGKNGFTNFQLPEAIIHLSQGVGRLIRDFDDSGVLMICDPRLIKKAYGRIILNSLPPFVVTHEFDKVKSFFKT